MQEAYDKFQKRHGEFGEHGQLDEYARTMKIYGSTNNIIETQKKE